MSVLIRQFSELKIGELVQGDGFKMIEAMSAIEVFSSRIMAIFENY
jgi:hypothetical protein